MKYLYEAGLYALIFLICVALFFIVPILLTVISDLYCKIYWFIKTRIQIPELVKISKILSCVGLSGDPETQALTLCKHFEKNYMDYKHFHPYVQISILLDECTEVNGTDSEQLKRIKELIPNYAELLKAKKKNKINEILEKLLTLLIFVFSIIFCVFIVVLLDKLGWIDL